MVNNTDYDKKMRLHKWFWHNFTISPDLSCRERLAESQTTSIDASASCSPKWRRSLNGEPELHHWFWKDFAIGPKVAVAHVHEDNPDADAMCWHDCSPL